MLAKLQALDADYKAVHLQIINLIDEDHEGLDAEQKHMDQLDDNVSVRLQALINSPAAVPAAPAPNRRSLNRRLVESEQVWIVLREPPLTQIILLSVSRN